MLKTIENNISLKNPKYYLSTRDNYTLKNK